MDESRTARFDAAVELRRRYTREGATELLDQAIDLSTGLLAEQGDSPDRAAVLIEYTNALTARAARLGRTEDSLAAVDAARAAVEMTPADSPALAARIAMLGTCSMTRWDKSGDDTDFDDAIRSYRRALQIDPEYVWALSGLGVALARRRAQGGGEPGDLAEARQLCERALAAIHEEADRPELLTDLGFVLFVSGQTGMDSALIDESLRLLENAYALAPHDSPDRWRAGVQAALADYVRAAMSRRREGMRAATGRISRTLDALPTDLPTRSMVQSVLGTALAMEYHLDGDSALRDRAIDLLEASIVGFEPGRGPLWSQTAEFLRTLLGHRAADIGSVADVDRIIVLLETERTVSPGSAELASELTAARGLKFSLVGDANLLASDLDSSDTAPLALAMSITSAALLAPNTLDQRIDRAESALADLAADAPDRFVLLTALGIAYLAVSAKRGDIEALNRAVSAEDAALELLDGNDPRRSGVLANVSRALVTRFGITGDDADLERACDAAAAASAGVAAGHSDRPNLDDALGYALLARFGRFGDPADLADAISAFRAAIDATAPDVPLRLIYSGGLGRALMQRYALYGEESDHQAAFELTRQVLSISPGGITDYISHLHAMTTTVTTEFVRTGDLHALNQAHDLVRRALDQASAIQRPTLLSDLGHILKLRSERLGSSADLDAAIQAGTEALATAGPGVRDRVRYAAALADALRLRSEHTASIEDADRAVATARSVSAPRPSVRDLSLATALTQRFNVTGASADLDEVVDICRTALSNVAADTTLWADLQRMLSHALWLRFRALDDLNDLDAAVATLDLLLVARDSGSDVARSYTDLYNRGGMLMDRFESTGKLTDLDDAIHGNRAAEKAVPAGHPHLSIIAAGLALLYRLRYEATGDYADLDVSIAYGSTALRGTPSQDGLRPGRQHVYGHSRWTKYKRTGSWWDLRATVKAFEAAVAATPVRHRAFGIRAHSLGEVLANRHLDSGRRRDRERALTLLRSAAESPTSSTGAQLLAARSLAAFQMSLGRPLDALESYRMCVQDLLPVLAWRGLDRRSQENQLKSTAGLASAAAAVALACGSPGAAVQLLEQGRGILWSQLLETRSDRDALREQAPDLAAEFDQLCAILDAPDKDEFVRFGTTLDGGQVPTDVDHGEQRRRTAQRFTELRDHIRALPGLADFLRPPDLASLQRAVDGPVAIINVDRLRCDAILITPGELRVVPLTALTDIEARTRAAALHRVLSGASNGVAGRIASTQTLDSTLEWLWDAVVFPVLDALGFHQGPPRRIWWYPTGALSSLPLHAAGRHRPGTDGRWAGDHVISSYIWTLQTLLREHKPIPDHGRMLAVGLARTPRPDVAYAELRAVPDEMRIVAAASMKTTTVLEEESATHAAVSAALPAHNRVHFACHGVQNVDAPSKSRLALHDSDLTLLDIVHARSDTDGEFAFLSACETARGDDVLADESIHLGAAFQLAGYRHVIGTLWSLADAAAPIVAREVYARTTDDAAVALHQAVHTLKKATGFTTPLSWAPFIHLGP
ncbi:CHAT domain-containing protein [Nocardia xishanensis]|uniref:CHAT domain-containing protein n=1 Tax=Nocardia xishanensis TaxID=238964 RepID=A0ABW7XC24_9NOCA